MKIKNMKKNNRKTLREQIIERLNNGFGYNLPPDVKIKHHKGTMCRNFGGFSWYVYDIRVPFEVVVLVVRCRNALNGKDGSLKLTMKKYMNISKIICMKIIFILKTRII